MEVFSSRSTLYRTAQWFVTLAAVLLVFVQVFSGQASRTPKKYKGPRALGLIQLSPSGKARLIPVAILIDGEFYDASAYKASPVPMALWAETVYEGFRTGVSQGLFTVSTGLQDQQTHEWFGDGRWLPAGSIPSKLGKKESSIPRGMNDDSGPPVLRHSGSAKPKAPESAPAQSPPAAQSAPPNTPAAQPPGPSAAPSGSASPGTPPATPPQPAPSTQAPASQQSSEPEDKDQPTLKRGKPAEKPDEPLPPLATPPKPAPQAAASPPAASTPKPEARLIPAISDADGPDAQPYNFVMTSDEEHQLRDKVLGLAAEEVRARARQLASEAIGSSEPAHGTARQKTKPTKPVQPNFEDVQFRAFDLSNSNEPVLVLMAKARLPKSANEPASADRQYIITLVARQDINGDLNKAFSNVTDNQHLDVIPDVQLIDAVDADGDGRGELLFRQVSDAGTSYVIYRVIGNQLYALFQGAPQ
jgi:hypothetical protein